LIRTDQMAAPDLPDQEFESRISLPAERDNPELFAQVYDRTVQPIYRYLLSRIQDVDAAKDLTSQTYLAALQAFPRYRHQGHLLAWLIFIARGKLIDHIRRNKFIVRMDESLPASMMENPEWSTERRERIHQLRALFPTLEADERELLRLRFAAGLRMADIAQMMGKSEEAIKKTLYRLLERMHQRMEADHE
jgi:RNA polymerase sigma-70 factor, ECF subfamily